MCFKVNGSGGQHVKSVVDRLQQLKSSKEINRESYGFRKQIQTHNHKQTQTHTHIHRSLRTCTGMQKEKIFFFGKVGIILIMKIFEKELIIPIILCAPGGGKIIVIVRLETGSYHLSKRIMNFEVGFQPGNAVLLSDIFTAQGGPSSVYTCPECSR